MYRLPNYKRATNAAYEVLQKQANISLPIDIEFVAKYSLQGTTQSRYLTGGVPPVRFSM